jgi:hypothetical protein
MSPWRTLGRWVAALLAVALLVLGLRFVLADRLTDERGDLGPPGRTINTIVDLGGDEATDCETVQVRRGDVLEPNRLRPDSRGCVVVGFADSKGRLGWFFVGRAVGDGQVVGPKPTRSGVNDVLLDNGAIVPIGDSVRVRCSPDPNERFEVWIARGQATAAYLDASGRLVGIDCEDSAA